MAQPTEVEVKLYVADLAAVAARLLQAEATLVAPRVYERNVRYDSADKRFSKGDGVLRLRQDSRARLTYKGAAQQMGDGISSRTELETEVADFAMMDTILQAIGFAPYFIYEKFRTTYHLDSCEIVLDELPYGNFVEIEGELATIEAMLRRLSLADEPRITASYTSLFYQVADALNLNAQHLTFAAFDGVRVPKSAILPSLA